MKSIQQIAQECFQEVVKNDKFDPKDIKTLIERHYKIQFPQIQPLKVQDCDVPYQGAHNNQSFVPSLDLMHTYQSTYTRTIDKAKQIPQNLVNARLQKLYGETNQIKNNIFPSRQRMEQSNPIIILQKQENLLQNIKKGKIQQTIPYIEQSLQKNQIKNLQKKHVFIQNNLTFKQLKEMRLKLSEDLQK